MEKKSKITQANIKAVMSELARRMHKKSPRTKEFYREMNKKSQQAKFDKKVIPKRSDK